MSDMKKFMEIMDGNMPKEILTEDCSHNDMPCACHSYLCETCYPVKKLNELKVPQVDRQANGDMPKTGGQPDEPAATDPDINLVGEESVFSEIGEINERDPREDAEPHELGRLKELAGLGENDSWEPGFANDNTPNVENVSREEFESKFDFDEVDDFDVIINYTKNGEQIAYFDDENYWGYIADTPVMQEDEDFEDEDTADAERDHNDYMVDIGDEGSEQEVEVPSTIDKDMGKAVQGSAPKNVDDKLEELMGMETIYSDDMLIAMKPERIEKIHARLTGTMEEVEPGNSDHHDPDYDEDHHEHNVEQAENNHDPFDSVKEEVGFNRDQFVNGTQINFDGSEQEMAQQVGKYDNIDDTAYPVTIYTLNGQPIGWYDDENMHGHIAALAEEAPMGSRRELDAASRAGFGSGPSKTASSFENEVHRLYQQTAQMDGAAEIVAKKMGVDVDDVRRVLDEQMVAEAELKRLTDLVNY